MSSIDVNALKSLLPQAVIQFALQHADSEPPLKQPFKTVALFADVSGFTKLSEAFASKGPQGAEELAFFLNRYMEQLVRYIARAGGDVFKFAGDAMLVLWVPPSDLDEDGIQKEIRTMAHRAVQTSIAIQNELHSADLTDGVTLSVKIGIGVGNATVLHVGGVYSRVEYFACGMPLMQAFKSEEKATQGDIIVSPDVWEYVQESFGGDILEENYVRITRQTQTVRNKSVKAGNNKHLQANAHELQKLLAKYIPAAVLPYLTRCQNSWSGELRLVTVLFVNVGVNLSNVQTIDHTSLAWIQQVITGIQKAIYKYEGSLNKFLVDDKGSNVIAVFGVPPLAHNDDATRGLLAALKLLRKMHGLGIKCYIGVTSGLVYTGLLGSGTSREYGVLGDAVNLAARLMAKQKKCGVPGVICDTTTQELIPSDAPIRFDPLEPFHVKGKTQLIKAFSPKYTENVLAYKPQSHYYNIGREKYLNVIDKSFTKDCSFVSLIESPIGSGKTFYMESIVNSILPKLNDEDMKNDEDANSSASNSMNNSIISPISNNNSRRESKRRDSNANNNPNCRIIWASGHHYVQSKNINIWLFIFGALLSKSNFTENRSYRQHVKTIFSNGGYHELIPYLSLANDVFGTQFLETEKCNNLNEEHRWDKKAECCLALLEYFSVKQKLVLCIDNLQWSVIADWNITEFVVNMITTSATLNNVFVFLSSRPLLSILYRPRFEAPPEQYRRIRKLLKSNKQLLTLRNWDLTEVTTFMCEYFAVDDVNPCLAHFVYERSGGNPAFVEWISELIDVHVTYCDDVLLLEMTDKTAQSITSEAPLQHPVPIKVHSVLMGYIDRLTPSQILLLKTAAAICMGHGSGSIIFDQQSVYDCYPVVEYKDAITIDLEHLCDIGIVRSIENGVLNYDIFSSSPNFFVHNHQWMHSAMFVSHILEVSFNKKKSKLPDKKKSGQLGMLKKEESDGKNYIFSRKLLHFFVNRLVFYSFDPQKGTSWRLKQIIAFNDPQKPIRLKRLSKEVLVVENNECLVHIRSKPARLDELYNTFDDALTSRGVMTQPQERDSTYPVLPRSVNNQLYAFRCGFFRDVIYGLMLLKQRQQLHDNAAKFLGQRWANSEDESEPEQQEPNKEEDEEEEKLSTIESGNEDSDAETVETVGLKRNMNQAVSSSVSSFTQIYRSKVLARHRDLALKDDTLRRMGSFYQAAPQANTAHDKSKRLQSITSFYTKIRSKGQDKHRIATLSPKNFRRPSMTHSIFTKLRQSLSPVARRTVSSDI